MGWLAVGVDFWRVFGYIWLYIVVVLVVLRRFGNVYMGHIGFCFFGVVLVVVLVGHVLLWIFGNLHLDWWWWGELGV